MASCRSATAVIKLRHGSTLQVTYTWSFASGSPTFTIPNSAAKDLVVPASILSGSAVAGTPFTNTVAAALSVRVAGMSHAAGAAPRQLQTFLPQQVLTGA